jgi:hypothetical protein
MPKQKDGERDDDAYLAGLEKAVDEAEAMANHERKTQIQNLESAMRDADEMGLAGADIDTAKAMLVRLLAEDAADAGPIQEVVEVAARKHAALHTGSTKELELGAEHVMLSVRARRFATAPPPNFTGRFWPAHLQRT